MTFSISTKKEAEAHHIFVNGALWRVVSPRLFGKRLKLEVDTFEELLALEKEKALSFAVRSLSAKAQHSIELKTKILNLGASEEAARYAIEKLEQLGYLDDEEWCRFFIRSQKARKLGKSAIAQKLRSKGIADDEFQPFLDEELPAEEQEKQIEALLRTKFKSKDLTNPKQKQQVIAGLCRRGFSWDLIAAALKR